MDAVLAAPSRAVCSSGLPFRSSCRESTEQPSIANAKLQPAAMLHAARPTPIAPTKHRYRLWATGTIRAARAVDSLCRLAYALAFIFQLVLRVPVTLRGPFPRSVRATKGSRCKTGAVPPL